MVCRWALFVLFWFSLMSVYFCLFGFFPSLREDIFNLQPSKRVAAGNIFFSLNSFRGKGQESNV